MGVHLHRGVRSRDSKQGAERGGSPARGRLDAGFAHRDRPAVEVAAHGSGGAGAGTCAGAVTHAALSA